MSGIGNLIGKTAEIGVSYGPDAVFGGMAINAARTPSDAVGEVVGLGANLTASAATGPIGVAIILLQSFGMLLDSLWNPFGTYLNKDLLVFKDMYNAALTKGMRAQGYNWPLEVKPPIIDYISNNTDEFREHMSKYFKNRGLINKADVLQEEALITELQKFKRMSKLFRQNADGEYDIRNPLFYSISEEEEMWILIAKAVAKKRRGNTTNGSLPNYNNSTTYKYLSANWQLLIIFVVLIFLISLSLVVIVV